MRETVVETMAVMVAATLEAAMEGVTLAAAIWVVVIWAVGISRWIDALGAVSWTNAWLMTMRPLTCFSYYI